MMNDLREMITEQYRYRELLYQMTKRDLLLRYKQTVMGFGWAVFMPLVNTAVFTVIFTRVAPIDVGMPYVLFAFCGLLTWNFFASSLKFSITSLTGNTSLVTKVYFPREIFPVSAVMVSVIDFAVASMLLVGLLVYYRVPPHWTLMLLPAVFLVHLAFTLAVALLLAMANLFYRDVKYLFEIVLTVWMFVTAVLYPAHLIGGRLGFIVQFNPMTPIIEAYRDVLIRGVVPGTPFVCTALASGVLLLWAWLAFHRAEFQFAENV
jgi:lipopolysaccharide transport system permease protein